MPRLSESKWPQEMEDARLSSEPVTAIHAQSFAKEAATGRRRRSAKFTTRHRFMPRLSESKWPQEDEDAHPSSESVSESCPGFRKASAGHRKWKTLAWVQNPSV